MIEQPSDARIPDGPSIGVRGLGIVTFLIGVGALVGGITTPMFGWYVAGLLIAAVGSGILLALLLARLPKGALRWAISIGLPVILIMVGLAVPQLLIGRPDSRPHWQTTGLGPTAALIGGRLYLHSRTSDQILDPRTGQGSVSVRAKEYGIVVGHDGSFVQRGEDGVVYRGPDGRQRWSIDAEERTPKVLAISDGLVVLHGCSAAGEVCGVDADGAISWRIERVKSRLWLGEVGFDLRQTAFGDADDGSSAVMEAPRVAVRADSGAGASRSQVYDAAGRLVATVDGRVIGIGGDLVISSSETGGKRAGTGCRIVGARGGQQVFRTDEFACTDGEIRAGLLLHKYFYAADGDRSSWVVDLDSGAVRQVADLKYFDDSSVEDRDGFPGDDVIVHREGQQLTGTDPATGQQLWTYRDGGDKIPGVGVQNGAVTVLGELRDRPATLSGIDPQDSPKSFTVLDARTGQVTARQVLTNADQSQEIWSSYGIAPGQALTMMVQGDIFAIGG